MKAAARPSASRTPITFLRLHQDERVSAFELMQGVDDAVDQASCGGWSRSVGSSTSVSVVDWKRWPRLDELGCADASALVRFPFCATARPPKAKSANKGWTLRMTDFAGRGVADCGQSPRSPTSLLDDVDRVEGVADMAASPVGMKMLAVEARRCPPLPGRDAGGRAGRVPYVRRRRPCHRCRRCRIPRAACRHRRGASSELVRQYRAPDLRFAPSVDPLPLGARTAWPCCLEPAGNAARFRLGSLACFARSPTSSDADLGPLPGSPRGPACVSRPAP